MSKRAAGGRKGEHLTCTYLMEGSPGNLRAMTEELELIIPIIPPSVNHYKKPYANRFGADNGKGKICWYRTAAADTFMDLVAIHARGQQIHLEAYYIEVWLNLGPKERMDVDNCGKVILDSLVKAGVIHSDAAVTDLALHKRRAAESSTQITIWKPAHQHVKEGLTGKFLGQKGR